MMPMSMPGSVGVEQCPRLHDLVELPEHLLFDRNALEHRFNDDVALGDVVKAVDRFDQLQSAFHIGLGQAAAPDARLLIAADALQAAVERLLARFEDPQPNSAKLIAMPPPIVPAGAEFAYA
jgi:hypothetical protein